MRLVARLFGVAGVLLATQGCTQSSTSLAEPSSSKCQITATNQQSSFPSAGGRGTVSIGGTRDCAWSIGANAPWIAIVGERSGLGDAVVNYTVSENPVPSPRTGMLTVDAVQLALNQAAAPCTYSIAPMEASIGAAGGSLTFTVTTLNGCPWSSVSDSPWIALSAGSSGTASATVGLTIGANGGGARDGTVSVAGRTFTARQAAASAPAPPAPAPPAPAPPAPAPPPPAPTPPPGTPETVEFEGLVIPLGGVCPNINFIAAGRIVVANGSTEYKKGHCSDLSLGDRVKVRGTATPGSPVTADRIEFKDDNN
jgi:Domain of unknown function (DUF5666)/Viral BACON domain